MRERFRPVTEHLFVVSVEHVGELGLHDGADRVPGADVLERHDRVEGDLGRPHRLEDVVDELANVELDDRHLLPERHHHGRPHARVLDVESVELQVLDHLDDALDVVGDRLDALSLSGQRDHLLAHHRVEVAHRLHHHQHCQAPFTRYNGRQTGCTTCLTTGCTTGLTTGCIV